MLSGFDNEPTGFIPVEASHALATIRGNTIQGTSVNPANPDRVTLYLANGHTVIIRPYGELLMFEHACYNANQASDEC